jgi:hypothetical protein
LTGLCIKFSNNISPLCLADQKKQIKNEKEENSEVNPNGHIIFSGKTYTVAGEYEAIKDIVGNYGSEIIGGFHETIDGGGGICYIRMPIAESEQETMLGKFREKKILVWRDKEVNQSTNGYELDLSNEEHLKFAIDNKGIIIFSVSPEIEKNIKKSIYPAKISYTVPNKCYCKLKPIGSKPVGTPNMCAMGVKIDTVKDSKKKNNKRIIMEDLEKILDLWKTRLRLTETGI